MKTALIPGSFDPMTLGHIDVIKRAARIFDKVIVAVMTNDSEKYGAAKSAKKYMFTKEERQMIATASLAEFENVTVISADGLLIDLFDRTGADVIVKGVRNQSDFAYEKLHSDWNIAHNPRAETLYMPSSKGELEGLSSTEVRALIHGGELIDGVMAQEAIPIIKKIREERKL